MSALAVEEELRALEEGRIDPKAFPHREHVRLGFEMLRRHSFVEAAARFARGLRALASQISRPQLYHETMTVAFLALRRAACDDVLHVVGGFYRAKRRPARQECVVRLVSARTTAIGTRASNFLSACAARFFGKPIVRICGLPCLTLRRQTMSALLYKQTGQWRIWFCLVAAAAIHLGAVSLAGYEPITASGFFEDVIIDGDLETSDPPPAEPIEEIPLPLPPTSQNIVVEDGATPPPVRSPKTQPRLVRLAPPNFSGLANPSAAKVLAITAPRPAYPYEARRQKLTGSGVAVLSIDRASGAVTNVQIAQTTGSAILDNAAVSGFRRWRFKPGTVASVRAPITFTLTGASY